MDESTPLLLAGALTFIFGWNNSSLLIGNELGSGTLSGREATVLASLGMVLGAVAEGPQMTKSLGGMIYAQPPETVVLVTLVASILLTFSLTLARIPVTFSATMVGAFIGAVFALSTPLRVSQLEVVFSFWLIAPLATMAVTFLCYRAIRRATSNMSLLSVDAFSRRGVGVVSLGLAYVLSANNLGLIYGTAVGAGSQTPGAADLILVALAAVAIAGIALFGRGGVAGTVGDRLLSLTPQGVLAAFVGTIVMMWVATQFAIPISITQCLLGGMFGAAYTKKIAVVNRRLALEVVASWLVVPAAAFVVAVVIGPLL
ncbi:MAG: inorganic phosphate transporter [Nitrososphaerota archaeon]|nr:inorganic phosphate transporter [Nitrososphaerota archaeon]MDG6966595.1 inorganic phosphate transporter [Nitrososphaerota archaeon]MDG6978546.1 inorganic phosphate transporter [Nitrososphaerota archaeon]MDG7021215.1 inorganic phosphate transporter [Nitrososphaerota archaeon]